MAAEQMEGEGWRSVGDHVVAVERVAVLEGELVRDRMAWVGGWQGGGDAGEHPGPAEVEAGKLAEF